MNLAPRTLYVASVSVESGRFLPESYFWWSGCYWIHVRVPAFILYRILCTALRVSREERARIHPDKANVHLPIKSIKIVLKLGVTDLARTATRAARSNS